MGKKRKRWSGHRPPSPVVDEIDHFDSFSNLFPQCGEVYYADKHPVTGYIDTEREWRCRRPKGHEGNHSQWTTV